MTSLSSSSRPQADKAQMLAVAIGVAIFCCLFFHGYEVFQYNLSIDEELMLTKVNLLNYVRLGRWGSFFFSWLRAPLPVTPMLGGLAFYSAAFVLLMRRLGIQHWQSISVAAVFFFGFPTLLYAFAFSNLTLSLGVGTLVSVLVVYVASIRTPARFLLAAFGVAFVTAIYQTLLFFLMVVVLADLAKTFFDKENISWRDCARLGLWYAGILIFGLLIYGLIYFGLLTYFQQQVDYLPSYLAPEKIFAHPIVIAKISLQQIWKVYSGTSPMFVGYKQPYRLAALLLVVILAIATIASFLKKPWLGIVSAALLIGIAAAPFLQHPLNGGEMPYRTLVAVPAAAAVLGLFATEAAPEPLRRWVLLPLMVLVAFQFSAINNKQYYAGHWALERDKVLGIQIISRIQEMFPEETAYTIAVVGKGPLKYDALIPNVPSSTLGTSFFWWDEGNDSRIAAFLNFLSSAKFTVADPDQVERAYQTSATMPSWPDRGSIARVDGVVLIKLSPPTKEQVKRLCGGRTSQFCAKYQP
jgi:hypothetical protein